MSESVKKHVALLIPHTDIILEQDLQMFLGDDYIIHTQRMWLDDVSQAAEQAMVREELPRAIQYLKGVTQYHCAIFGCTSASVACGYDSMHEIAELISTELGCPAITTFGAVLNAIERRDHTAVAMFAPYTSEVLNFAADSLRHFEINVPHTHGMGILSDMEILKVPPQEVFRFITAQKETILPECTLCFASCTNFRSMEIREQLEEALGIPCVTSNFSIIEYIRSV